MAAEQIKGEHASLALRKKGVSSPAAPVVIACGTGFSYTQSRESVDITCLGQAAGASNAEPGLYSANISMDGTYRLFTDADIATNVGGQHMDEWMRAGDILEFVILLDSTTGTISRSGECFLTNFSETHTGGQPSTYTIDLQIKGLPVRVLTDKP